MKDNPTRITQSPSPEPMPSVSPEATEAKATDSACQSETAKPQLVFRVGVTGHRDLAQSEVPRLSAEISDVLQRIVRIAQIIHGRRKESDLEIYSDAPPLLRIISPLAEGADRIVAKEATLLNFKLQAPLPFPRNDYEVDFQLTEDHPFDTTQEFQALLDKANKHVLIMDGRPQASESYEAVGRLVLRQCDVLIAIWDPEKEEKAGGTRQIVRESLGLELPTIWISAQVKEPKPPCLLLAIDPQVTEEIENLDERVTKLFFFGKERWKAEGNPAKQKRAAEKWEKEKKVAELFFGGKLPTGDPGRLFRWFRNFWCWTFKKNQDTEPNWKDLFDGNPEFQRKIEHNYRSADTLAKYYGGLYRSSFIATYCMGALAVLCAFLGFFFEGETSHYLFPSIELLLIGIISGITVVGRRNNWHQRWMDYRVLAENLRQVKFLVPLGRVTLSLKVPAHLQPSDPRNSWFNWYFRALVREGGMLRTRFSPDYLDACRKVLSDAIQGQIDYHEDNHKNLERLSRNLHVAGQISFAIAATACVLHFRHWLEGSTMSFLVNLGTIVLPVFGGALGAISHQGEFERLALRSEALAERLAALKNDLEKAGSSSRELGRIAETFSEVMVGELLDWHFAFLDKNLSLPA